MSWVFLKYKLIYTIVQYFCDFLNCFISIVLLIERVVDPMVLIQITDEPVCGWVDIRFMCLFAGNPLLQIAISETF